MSADDCCIISGKFLPRAHALMGGSQNSQLVRHPRRPLIRRLSFPYRESRLQKSGKSKHQRVLEGERGKQPDLRDLRGRRASGGGQWVAHFPSPCLRLIGASQRAEAVAPRLPSASRQGLLGFEHVIAARVTHEGLGLPSRCGLRIVAGSPMGNLAAFDVSTQTRRNALHCGDRVSGRECRRRDANRDCAATVNLARPAQRVLCFRRD